MDVDDYDAIMMEENEDFISPSPSGEDFFDEKSGGQRLAPQRIVDKNFFNDFPDLFDEDLSFHASGQDRQYHNKTHYELLGLSKEATRKEIKSQFYKLSKLYHPDKNDSDASRKEFLAINEAYSVLGNERQRRDYDLTLLDRTGSLYSSSSSPSSSRAAPNRGTLRRTPFRHSAQSAAAAAAARQHAAFRPNVMGKGAPGFDSKSHQEMHYEQEIRQEERRRQRQRENPDFQWKQRYDESDSPVGKLMRVSFVFLVVVVASSFMKAFADENEDENHTGTTSTNNTSTIPFIATSDRTT